MIQLNDVSVAAPGHLLLCHANATISGGEVSLLRGPVEGDAAIVLRAIADAHPFVGEILFDGRSIRDARSALYTCYREATVLPALTGLQNIALLAGRAVDLSVVNRACAGLLSVAELSGLAGDANADLRRRLHLVAALVSEASYLLLEDALDGLTAQAVAAFGLLCGQLLPQATVVITSISSRSDAVIATRILEMADGALTERAASAAP
jgi:ABC-type multidrug transport system ATPase subunit